MFLTYSLEALEHNTNEMLQYCKDTLNYGRSSSRLKLRNSMRSCALSLGPTILTTLLTIPEMHFKIIRVAIARDILSAAALASLRLHPAVNEEEARKQLSRITTHITAFASNHPETDTKTCAIYVIRTTSGLTNLKKELAKANYEPLNILGLEDYPEHKVDVYNILNTVFILSNDPDSIHYQALAGYLPILFKDAYANLKNYPELYEFYKTAYNTKSVNNALLKNFECFKNVKKIMRDRKLTTFIEKIETSICSNIANKIVNLERDIASLEASLTEYYNKLNTQLRLQSCGMAIADKELITMLLKNNPNILDAAPTGRTLEYTLTTFGPVDYDRKAMQSTLKTKTNFIKWLFTTTEYTLCWESVCIINLENNTISAARDSRSAFKNIRNTHWHRYQCFGNNYTPIAKALAKHDYLGALSQIITAAQLLNAYDVTVLNALIDDLCYDRAQHKAFINNNTKEMFSTAEMEAIFKQIQAKEAETIAE